MKKPISRSKVRLFLGSNYYLIKRYFKWYFSGIRWANSFKEELLDHLDFQHKTPLIRELRNVDMWMQYNKITNLKIATKKIDKLVLYPGETFSFWRLIGRPTAKKGYLKGMVLNNGQVDVGIGGGLCQLSNLIYWMTLHTPLTITERYRHTYDVFPDADRALPFGSGATCAYNYIDLQIYNNTTQPYQLNLYLDNENLVGEWRTDVEPEERYEVYQKSHWITQEYWGGYVRHNIICRKVYNLEGELIDDEYLTENHALMMYQPFLEEGEQSA